MASEIVKSSADTQVGSSSLTLDTEGQSVQVCFDIDDMTEPSHVLHGEYRLCHVGGLFALNKAFNFLHLVFEIALS